ncbi:MAG: hypothetical protein HZA90_04985 [Verrucomicrobia bacterium]|nr:hypothetical protein [Verrucomicrobiota bacterium]
MKKKLTIAGLAMAVLLVVGGFWVARSADRLHAPARKQWKEKAIGDITRRISDPNWLASQRNKLKAEAAADAENWFTDQLIPLGNSEWIAYAAKCSKEDSRIHDIFIGRGSDGKWYYSTFHFCIGMLDLRVEGQSESLTNFIEKYYVREFDGRSDDCLEKTWPPKRR